MTRRTIDTLIIDLDNTIFDWFEVWYASFRPIYDEIIQVTGRPQEEVDSDIRAVHQAHRTSEYSFLIEEVAALKAARDSGDIRLTFKDAISRSREARDHTLKLYP